LQQQLQLLSVRPDAAINTASNSGSGISSLPTWAIAGIVIAVIVGILFIAVLVQVLVMFVFK